jgi:hypothetical protein
VAITPERQAEKLSGSTAAAHARTRKQNQMSAA